MANKKKKVLLIKLSSLGDVIFNIPFANALKSAGYEVSWLVSEKGYQVIKDNPCVDKAILAPVVAWNKRGLCQQNVKEYLKILKQIRAEKYDYAIDTQMLLKSMCWMLFCGAKTRITSIEAREFAFLGANKIIGKVSIPKAPIVKSYMRFGKPLGINENDIKITLPERSAEQIRKVDELLSDLDKNKPLVAVAPATTWANKHWNKDYWKEVIEKLTPKCNIIFTGGPNDSDLINYISQPENKNFAGKTDLLELAELFSRASLVISPDSGSAHLAWATQKPAIITLFTCTPPEVLAPYGNSDKYVALGGKGLPCQTCFKRKCLLKEDINACTKVTSPQEVLETVERLIF